MSFEDEIHASEQKIKRQMEEEARRKYVQQQMQEFTKKNRLSEYSCEVFGVPSELASVYNEITGSAAFRDRMVMLTAPNGHTYIRMADRTNDKSEYGNAGGFVVLMHETGSGKDRSVDEIWFLPDGRCTFRINNNAAVWSGFRTRYTPAQVRQKAIDAVATQRLTGAPSHAPGTGAASGTRSVSPSTYKGSYSGSSEGCYIATAVYGGYDCPEVRVFRRYRDERLKKTAPGRAFIRAYYAVSPRLVRRFGDSPRFIRVWRRYLDGKLARLLKEGFGETEGRDE